MDFNDLTEEQKAKALACTSPEELASLAFKDGVELSVDQLDGAVGGWGEAECGSKVEAPCSYTAPHPC